ncbi:MAG: hypothetical protein QNI87_11105 [Erythrobacter sp.]|uniref:hypothetical protein n=1 Tax=Erythrobacter sp. TaxID=1042 RepID=UPI002617D2A2|nr:hypothetical protein [Erythrobacter sp.]MDJ0979067.1 hypothetical protein [Erythrobacter sp.]
MFWPYLAIGFGFVFAVMVFTRALARKAPFMGWLSATFLVLNASFNSAAPLRGVIDPTYSGYQYGMLSAQSGFAVTAIAGTVVVLFLLAAWIVTCGRVDRSFFVAAAILLLAGLNTLIPSLTDGATSVFELGEFIRLEGIAALAAILSLTSLPLLIGGAWALSKALQLSADGQVRA